MIRRGFAILGLVILLGIAGLGVLGFKIYQAAQVAIDEPLGGSSIWYPNDSLNATLVDTSWGVEIASLANCDTIDTDGDGVMSCGTDAGAATSTGTLTTIKEATVQVGGADIITLDYGAGFDLAESPDTEVNITLDMTEISGHDDFTDFVADEHIDWTADQGATNIDAGNYTDTNTTYSATGTLLALAGTEFSLNEGTLTDNKLCEYESTGTQIQCTLTNNIANWETAYGWGDHSGQGYLTGNETITLSGQVTGSGATAITTTITASNSAFWATKFTDETGTGVFVRGTTPTIATPNLTGKIDNNNVSVDDDSCVNDQGKWWYDDTDNQFEFCNANSGAPVPMASASGDITDVFSCVSADCNAITVESGDTFEFDPGAEVEASEVILSVNNDSGSIIYACTAVYISAFDIPSNLPEISIADADNAAKMPVIGLVEDDIANGANGKVLIIGDHEAWDTSGFTVGDSLYINTSGTSADDTCSNTLTATRPTGTTALIQKIGSVMRVHATSGEIEVSGANRSNDLPNLESAYLWVGNGTNMATAVQLSSDVTMDNAGAVTIAASNSAYWATKVTDETGTGLQCFATNPTFTTNINVPQVTWTAANTSPNSLGEMLYDSVVTGIASGAMTWYDDGVRYLVDLKVLPSNDDYVVAYDADADGYYMKVDSTTASGLDGLTDVTITSQADLELLQASGGSLWVNRTLSEAGVQAQDAFLDDIAALTDPNADKIIGWDDTAGVMILFDLSIGIGTVGDDLKVGNLTSFEFANGDWTDMTVLNGAVTINATTSAEWLTKVTDETGSGLWVFGTSPVFTTSVQMPFGASPTVDATGEMAFDTTADQLIYYSGGETRVLTWNKVGCTNIENLAAADDDMPLASWPYAVTITAGWGHCNGTCTTNATIDFQDSDGNGMTMTDFTTSDWGAEPTPQAITGANGLIAYEGFSFNVTNAVSPETDDYQICFGFKVIPQ